MGGEFKSLLITAVIDDGSKDLSRIELAGNGAQVDRLVNKYLLSFGAVVVSQHWKTNTCESGEFGAVLKILVFFGDVCKRQGSLSARSLLPPTEVWIL